MSASRKIYWLFGMAIGVFAGGVLGSGIPATLAESGGKGTVASDLEDHDRRIKELTAAVKSLQDVVEGQKQALATQSLSFKKASFGGSQLYTAEDGSIELGSFARRALPSNSRTPNPGDFNIRLMNYYTGYLNVYGSLWVNQIIEGPTITAIDTRLKNLETNAVQIGQAIGLRNPASTKCMDLRAQPMGNWRVLQGDICKELGVGEQTWTIHRR